MVAESVIGVAIFIKSRWAMEKFNLLVLETIERYRDDPDLQFLVDFANKNVTFSNFGFSKFYINI